MDRGAAAAHHDLVIESLSALTFKVIGWRVCRLLGIVGSVEADELLAFRPLAATGLVPNDSRGHGDGWGIVTGPRLAYAGRSAASAHDDPGFEAAARKTHGAPLAIAHLRKASAGAASVENSHPFIADGLAFCHNGTVKDLAAEGQSDSRAIFDAIRERTRQGDPPAEALASVARRIDAGHDYTSLTCLLTDGTTLWGLRRIGNDTAECGGKECALDFYTLGFARRAATTIVAQEHHLAGTSDWTVVPDGHMVSIDASGARLSKVF